LRKAAPPRRHSYAYNIFIFALTLISLVIMVAMLLPLSDAAVGLLQVYDTLICAIFLVDFFLCLSRAPKKSVYFLKEGGWLDLLGSVPVISLAYKHLGIIRLARLNRLVRIRRSLQDTKRKEFFDDVDQNRSQYTIFITVLIIITVLTTASVLVLQFESQSPAAKITNGSDALWYSLVTITTVGYGDFYPVTAWGRITAMFIMISGVGLIGVLASLLSDMLIRPPSTRKEENAPAPTSTLAVQQELSEIKQELSEVKKELAAVRQWLDKMTVKEIDQ
jgi:voltage-gated potassium channel